METAKVYSVTIRNPVVGLAAGLAVAGAGAVLLVVGLAVVGGVVVAGGALGAGVVAYRRLRGERGEIAPAPQRRVPGLDPALEVFPEHGKAPGAAAPPRRPP